MRRLRTSQMQRLPPTSPDARSGSKGWWQTELTGVAHVKVCVHCPVPTVFFYIPVRRFFFPTPTHQFSKVSDLVYLLFQVTIYSPWLFFKQMRACPVRMSHILMVLSSHPEKMLLRSGPNSTEVTALMWPSSCTACPGACESFLWNKNIIISIIIINNAKTDIWWWWWWFKKIYDDDDADDDE